MDATQDSRKRRLICLALALFSLATYWRATHNGFINFDDDVYVTNNPWVNGGLTFSGITWAFTHFYAANWHPITWLSHMLDCQLFGVNPGPQHAVNLLIHAANVVLLFLLLDRMTGAFWRSAMVAGLFAVHPLHVESVAWIAERKDLLCTFFGLLALLCYARHVASERLRVSDTTATGSLSMHQELRYYWLALLFFALGLMSKPMLVTLPFVMVLLDFWPLERFKFPGSRFNVGELKRLLVEKAPFFILTAIVCVVTYCAQKSGGATTMTNHVASYRIANALVSYLHYIERMAWPGKLAVIYPFSTIPVWQSAFDAMVLLVISLFCVTAAKSRPYLLMGWLWYLGTLIPVIGLVQAGNQSSADRYTYVPLIGLFIIVVWGAADLLEAVKVRRSVAGFISALVLLSLAVDTTYQLQFWKNGIKLFGRALAITTDNAVAQNNYAVALVEAGDTRDALAHYAEAARLAPDDALSQDNYGAALARAGQTDAAIEEFKAAIRLQPNSADAYNNLGVALTGEGLYDQAASALSRALAIDPGNADVHYNLGLALLSLQRVPDAMQELSEAVNLNPALPKAQYQLGHCLAMMHQPEAAVSHLREAIRLQPDWIEPLNALAWILSTDGDGSVRNGPEAVKLAESATTLSQGQQPLILNTLAAAYAEAGRFDDATNTVSHAIALAQRSGQSRLAAQMQSFLQLYQQHRAFHHP
jgi:tetratricopeptide (TPR) repeat protein